MLRLRLRRLIMFMLVLLGLHMAVVPVALAGLASFRGMAAQDAASSYLVGCDGDCCDMVRARCAAPCAPSCGLLLPAPLATAWLASPSGKDWGDLTHALRSGRDVEVDDPPPR